MKILTWFTVISTAVFGGTFLMPYKTVIISVQEITLLIIGAVIVGFLSGYWLARPLKRFTLILLPPITTFLVTTGVLGTAINFGFFVTGTPALAILAMSAGFGMIGFCFVSRYRHAQ